MIGDMEYFMNIDVVYYLINDIDIVLAAVSNDSNSLEFASTDMKNNYDVIIINDIPQIYKNFYNLMTYNDMALLFYKDNASLIMKCDICYNRLYYIIPVGCNYLK